MGESPKLLKSAIEFFSTNARKLRGPGSSSMETQRNGMLPISWLTAISKGCSRFVISGGALSLPSSQVG